jgi:ribose transport system substrate-binding protein
MMKRVLLVLLSCLFLFAPQVASRDAPLHIVFIPKSNDQDFWIFMRQGVDKAIREVGNVSLTWRGPAYNDDTDSQIKILQTYTKPGIDAIIIAPTDRDRLAEPIRKATELKIAVIVVDSAVSGDNYQNFITTDNYAAGVLAATHLAGLLDGEGNIAVLRTVEGSASTDDRARGFIDTLQQRYPKLAIVADIYGGGSRGRAMRSAEALLKSTPQIDGIFAVNESSTDGMLRALRTQARAGSIKLIGFDSTDFLIEGLDKGEIAGLIVQNPREMGYLGMKAAVAAARNAPIVDKTVFTPATMVTRDNYHEPDIWNLLVP